ncbi:hypothetical protein HYX02_03245 [Candidatus Woesearchaeota archaeon]|nr:hypothetical protein [Candidatus Woesearchaeota archaeon]
MSKMNKFFILIALILLTLNAAYAASFDVKVTAIKDRIVVDELAEFDIAIQNNLETEEEFTIKKAGYPFWDMYTKPLQNPITLKVPASSSASIRLFVDPLYITSVDTYTLDIGVVRERANQEQKVPVTVGIKSTEPLIGGYIPTIVTSTSIFPEKIDPREELTIKIVLNNQNPINYSNLTIKIEGNLFKDETHTPLGPKEEKSIEVVKKLDAITPPQEDRLVIAVFKDGRMVVNPIVNEFEVVEYVALEELQKQESFLKVKSGIKVMSNNPSYKGVATMEVSPFKALFTSTQPRASTKREGDNYHLVWNIELGKDKTMTVYATENYRPIVVIFVLAIAGVVLYFLFRSPIIARKGISNVLTSEGGVSEAKVVIRVKNRSANKITNIEVMDNLPHIAHVEKELSIGSMQPHAVLQHPKKGMIIKWTIETLEPGDERVLSYRMKSRLAILGEFTLPAANARCKVGNKVVITNSNRVSVGG